MLVSYKLTNLVFLNLNKKSFTFVIPTQYFNPFKFPYLFYSLNYYLPPAPHIPILSFLTSFSLENYNALN